MRLSLYPPVAVVTDPVTGSQSVAPEPDELAQGYVK